ncbi:unnamed protein product [Prorocentrum cordatum]|uniref:Uncharacterized protein n=1 Tax=Prorocentrum cordatum TaxID=2364126 RepID=A0ABN9VM66_9DINO|nr:unnamed protein product [Polarella glacialis]
MDASIDDLQFYRSALSAQDVNDVYAATPAPTPAPTQAVTPPTSATATGDPHLQNIHGERFDLMTPGKVTLVNIPRGKRVEDALLAIEADARRLGGHCADTYFQEVNITGVWPDKLKAGGFTFNAEGFQRHKVQKWTKFGPLEVKVVHGRTETGIQYLNVLVKHLGHAGFAVGGLLGEDDHTDVGGAQDPSKPELGLADVFLTSVSWILTVRSSWDVCSGSSRQISDWASAFL